MMVPREGSWRGERGSAAVELSVAAVILIAFALLIIGLGRMAHARTDVTGAANEAARSASLQTSRGAAEAAARAAAQAALADRGLSCQQLSIDVNTAGLEPGGEVSVRVECVAKLADISLVWGHGSKTFSETAVAPIEQYRIVGG